jgi:hypothetical protein
MDERHDVRIPDLVYLAAFPIYGVFDPVSDLSVCGLSTSGHVWEGISSIGFIFGSTPSQQGREHFRVSSSDVRERHIFYDPELAVNDLFERYRLSKEEWEQAGNLSVWEGGMLIDDETFIGEIRHWPQPDQLSLFRLKSEKNLLSGNACDLSLDELFQLLKGLRVINQQKDLLARYQDELDEELQRLFLQRKETHK